VPAGGGTAHFDHLVVSRFGVFVIDALARRGSISGKQVQARWKQRRFGKSVQFDNPLHENFLKVQSLERLLALPINVFHSYVVMMGHNSALSDVPKNVLTPETLVRRIRSESRQLLSADQASEVTRQLHRDALPNEFARQRFRWKVLRWLLLAALLASVYTVYRQPIDQAIETVQRHSDQRMKPEAYHSDGTPKTELELYQDSLICARSIDTDRCTCYEPGGRVADLAQDQCESLADRGSVLNQ